MSDIDGLLSEWLDAKAQETAAQKRRTKIEAEITAAFDTKPEGSITHKTERHKVTLTQPISRKVDAAVWGSVRDLIPEQLRPVKVKLETDAKGMKWLAENEPAMWSKIAPAFETKPGKIGVKVEEINNGN